MASPKKKFPSTTLFSKYGIQNSELIIRIEVNIEPFGPSCRTVVFGEDLSIPTSHTCVRFYDIHNLIATYHKAQLGSIGKLLTLLGIRMASSLK